MAPDSTQAALIECLRPRVADSAWLWFTDTRARLKADRSSGIVLGAYTAVRRRLGRALLALSERDSDFVARIDTELDLRQWRVDDLGRAVLLLELADTQDMDAYVDLVLEVYDQGDAQEQSSWLRGLGLLPFGDRFLTAAIDACRTSIVPLFEAIACENPYPARHFPELNFNQMVLKAFFNDIAIARIIRLERRLNPGLSRMAADYVAERRAAGRRVPPDIGVVIDQPSHRVLEHS